MESYKVLGIDFSGHGEGGNRLHAAGQPFGDKLTAATAGSRGNVCLFRGEANVFFSDLPVQTLTADSSQIHPKFLGQSFCPWRRQSPGSGGSPGIFAVVARRRYRWERDADFANR